MLGSDVISVADTVAHEKLHQWLSRVKPINSFVSHVRPDQLEIQDHPDSLEISAVWLNVHSGTAIETF